MPASDAPTIKTARFPHADLEIARVGFGCASLMRLASARARRELLATAFDHGIRHFDLARMYGLGAAEAEVGRFAKGRRDQLTIATKFGIEPTSGLAKLARFQQPVRAFLNRVPAARRAIKRRGEALNAPRQYDADIARRSLDTSLQELGVDYIDILFVHDPAPHDDVHLAKLTTFFEEARTAGKIRAWGVSQDAHPGLNLVDGLGPSAVLQIRDDIFTRKSMAKPAITFGVLGSAHERIIGVLRADGALRARWSDALGADPCTGDTLAALLLADAVHANAAGAVLFSTTRADRIPLAASALEAPLAAEQLQSFRDLVTLI